MRALVALMLIASCSVPARAADAPAYGAADFVPTPERPVGWLGDGTGRYPGATPPVEWDEATRKNIIWQTGLPMPSAAQPVVVGDRVFTMSDPDLLVCVDAKDGTILWQAECFDDIFPDAKGDRDALRQALTEAIDTNYYLYQGGKSWNVKWSVRWKEYAKKLPKNEPLQRLAKLLDTIHPNVIKAFNKGETNIREFKTNEVLKDTGLPMGYEQEDFDWYTCTFAPPHSDGQRVYARFMFNTVVAFDLDGKKLWTWRNPGKRRGMGINTHPLHQCGTLLYVPVGSKSGAQLVILDAETGKELKRHKTLRHKHKEDRKPEDAWGWYQGQVLAPVTVDGTLYYLTGAWRSRAHLIEAKTGEVVGHVQGGPGVGSGGSVFVGDVIYTLHGSYGAKEKTGASAARLVKEDGAWRLQQLWRTMQGGKKDIPAWKKDTTFVNGEHLGWRDHNVKMTWRGLCADEARVFGCGDSHKVVQFDPATGQVLDINKPLKERCSHTNEPVIAGGKAYLSTWSGITQVYDVKTGKFLGANRTEPIQGGTLTFQGTRAYLRGFYHLYCVGE